MQFISNTLEPRREWDRVRGQLEADEEDSGEHYNLHCSLGQHRETAEYCQHVRNPGNPPYQPAALSLANCAARYTLAYPHACTLTVHMAHRCTNTGIMIGTHTVHT